MPIYEFRCNEDDEVFDVVVSIKDYDAALVRCEEHPDAEVTRLYSPAYVAAIPGIPNRINKDWDESGAVMFDPKKPEAPAPKWNNRRQMKRPLRHRDAEGNVVG